MKKRNEDGYVLVYVMVVVFVLCAIALALMSGTLRTLQAQEAMVQRTKDKYAAMGEIERIVAELEATTADLVLTDDGFDSQSQAQDEALSAFDSIMKKYGTDLDSTNNYVFKLSHTADSVQLDAEILISPIFDFDDYTVEVEVENTREPGTYTTITETRWKYNVKFDSPAFSSYSLSTISVPTEGGDSK